MPSVSRALLALTLAALAAAVAPAGAGAADDVVAELRVVAPGSELEPGASYVTNTEKIKTDPKAKCFFGGEGGSGETVTLAGPTAMGLLETGGDVNDALDPLSVTDEFGFGLGLCAIGDVEAGENDYWSLTVDHQAAQVGGDQFELSDGDTVLWSLTRFPPPNELELRAPPGATPGTRDVSVFEWDCSSGSACTESPAEGATVTGGDSPALTNAAGIASVPMASTGHYDLQATLTGRLDSNHSRVCVSGEAGACPAQSDPVGRTIYGRKAGDEFAATDGWDVIRARGGGDEIDITRGGADRVNCGGGADKVFVSKGDDDDGIADNCEKVKRLAG